MVGRREERRRLAEEEVGLDFFFIDIICVSKKVSMQCVEDFVNFKSLLKNNPAIQGPHDKLALKEFLSHTLTNKVFFLIFLVFHDNNIQKRIKTKKIDEATPCLGDVVDSRAVVGLGERNYHI